MSDLLNMVMKDPKIKREIMAQAGKAIRSITFTKKEIEKIKIAIMNGIIKTCTLETNEDGFYSFIIDKIQEFDDKRNERINY